MTPCANDHPPILHDEFYCPLCVQMEDFGEEAVDGLKQQIEDREAELDTMRRTKHGQLIIDRDRAVKEVEEAEAAAILAERKLSALQHAVWLALNRAKTKAAMMTELNRAYLQSIKREDTANVA